MASPSSRVVVLVAARDEVGRVASTVEAAARIPGVSEVVVVDDGSVDGTARAARDAGARVLVAPRNVGKGGALEAALARVDPADVYLLLDADVGETAVAAGALLAEVTSGAADVAIGVLPRDPAHGGFRLVKRLAARVIRALSGYVAAEPLSGQRAVRGAVMDAVRPLASGFGVEVGMTVDAVRLGFVVTEVPVSMRHRSTGRDVRGFVHRARQGIDLLLAASLRAVGLR